MSIFARAEAVAAGIEHSAQSIFVKVFGADALKQFEADIALIFREDVVVIFQDAIVAAESLVITVPADGETPASQNPASNAQKRSAAFSQITTDLAAKGLSLGEHVINLGIELVVGLVKAKTPVAA